MSSFDPVPYATYALPLSIQPEQSGNVPALHLPRVISPYHIDIYREEGAVFARRGMGVETATCRLISEREHKMVNVNTKRNGDQLIITVDISKAALEAATASKSGKTRIVASTGGFTGEGPVKYSLNVTC